MTNELTLNKDLVLAGPLGSLGAYINIVNEVPVLSKDEEKELALRYQQDNDLDAARQLILSQLRFVVYIARSYSGYGLPLADLIQEGNVGLMKAVKRFDPEYGVRLVTYTVHWIRAAIHEFIFNIHDHILDCNMFYNLYIFDNIYLYYSISSFLLF